jgi:ribonuclease HI
VNEWDILRRAEVELLTSTVRRDAKRVGELLAPDFVEIGRSGKRWDRESIIATLRDEEPQPTPVTDDWEFTALTAGLTLVTYVIRAPDHDSRHSSIWDTTTGSPVLRFHQGTVIA